MEGLPNLQGQNFEKRRDPERMFNSYLRILKLNVEDLRFPLLDVGAHTGGFVTFCRENLNHLDCFGVEPCDHNRGNTEGVVEGSAQSIPFADESFEMVVSKNVMPMFKANFEKARTALDEMLRVLRVGGELIFDFSSVEKVQRFFEEVVERGEDKTQQERILKENIEGITQFNEYLEKLRERVQGIEVDADSIIKIVK
jgi:SAM-dependent methyltransferase